MCLGTCPKSRKADRSRGRLMAANAFPTKAEAATPVMRDGLDILFTAVKDFDYVFLYEKL